MPLQRNKIIVGVVTLCAAAVFLYTLFHAAVYSVGDETDSGFMPAAISISTSVVGIPASAAGKPARIRIPSIGVDTSVVDVGISKSGNMAVPYTYTEVGWYRYGTQPGNVGSAVLDGHVDNGLGGAAVFARLAELRAGDTIYIDTESGETLEFRVEEGQSYAVAEVPRERLFNRNDQPRLNLITCEGVWMQDQKMYDRRYVVYAVLTSGNS